MSLNSRHTATVLREWMKEEKMTNVELAKKLGTSESLVRALLKGERRFTPARIEQLTIVTGISRNELLGISNEEEIAGFSIMLRGSVNLSEQHKNEIHRLALLMDDYETMKSL